MGGSARANGPQGWRWSAPAQPVLDDPAPPFTWRRARQVMLWPFLGPLVFLLFPVMTVVEQASAEQLPFGLLNLALLAGLFVSASPAVDLPLRWRVGLVVVFVVVLFAGWPVLGLGVLTNAIYVGALSAFLLPSRVAVPVSVGWGGCVMVMGAIAADQVIVLIGAFAAGLGVALSLGLRAVRSEALLARTRLQLEQAMLAAERARIARDVHDILGHSLTAIAVKADLTERLLKVDAGRAAAEVSDIKDVSRQALADLRATTSGLREVSLGGEIAAARAVLLAAGIELRAPARLDPLPDEDATVLGYVVREAVTNVARHADATWCSIDVTGAGVMISDNGRGLGERAAGSGLTGLAERVEAAGGTLSVTEREGGGVVVLARSA